MAAAGKEGAAKTAGAPVAARPRRERPDPRPSRLVVGAGAMAALTVISAGLVRFPIAAGDFDATGRTKVGSPTEGRPKAGVNAGSQARKTRPVRYVHLKRGQKAPRGAKVIQKPAPPPRVVVRYVSGSTSSPGTRSVTRAPATSRPAVRRSPVRKPVTRTRQSG